ncbi:MAG: hypothetical protein O3C58_12285 [Nitrospinae bacterium]|jgi:hypothetical protein|nr:hypothetical protein [Nitrospinota bacterium]
MKWIIGLSFIFLIFSGCAKSLKTLLPPIVEPSPISAPEKLTEEPAKPPPWVLANRRGAGEYIANGAFFGVGNSSGERDGSELFASPDDRARNIVAGMFRSFQKSLANSFSSVGVNKINSQDTGNENIPSGIQKVTATLLMEMEIVDHWEDRSEDQFYSLAKLDLNKFKERLNNYPLFSRITQEAIKERSDKLIQEMEQNIDNKKIMTRNGAGYDNQSKRFYLY